MQGFRTQFHALTDLGIQVNEQALCCRNINRWPTELQMAAAGADGHAKALFDLSQVAVQVAAERRQMAGVIRFQSQALLHQLSRRRLRGRFAVQGILSPQWAVQLQIRIYGISRPSTIDQYSPERVGQSILYLYINKMADQAPVGCGKVDHPVVLGATLQLPRVFAGGPADQNALCRADHFSADIGGLLQNTALQDL